MTRSHPSPDDLQYWIALTLVPDVGILSANRLLRALGNPAQIWSCDSKSLLSRGVPLHAVDEIASGRLLCKAEELLEKSRALGVAVVAQDDARYPERLRQIPDPPLLLYVRGDASLLAQASLAVVGARRPSSYGQKITEWLAGELAARGLVVVSGLARGIDAAAHRSALQSGGKTAAVLGNGADIVYPRDNLRIFNQIVEHGAVVTEFPLGTYPAPQNFPVRNRIISGLSLGTLVVEAAEFSGSLITARLALEQNREIFAVPGNITSSKSFGPNYLIKQGAKIVQVIDDVLDELPEQVRRSLRQPPVAAAAEFSEEQRVLLRHLEVETPLHLDQLLERTGLALARLNALLFELEAAGHIECVAGNRYLKKYSPR